ncbi:coiled-coil domain-containing protein 130 homolog [Anthonomus grandis grandis]|uniref:coiled-coil domain-containing protein 130 homolog n=1 Tax=Anthonomus grandis grandis TaxID=2921223 RepID=UPI002166A84A|nr:coiled-coil domain-containing protein 130 homolog [Anthonomus grandis grandis]
MGERKGTNKYYPPDYDPKYGGLNKFLGTHALRERARKIDKGIIIIRFEMPYNIWCEGCKNHIGMGVRYNAEKTKVGMYYTTPVYEFKMKCHLCDNHFVIRADPANLDYVIQSGARRQENRWDPTQNGQVVPETKETQKRLFDDQMYKLEHGTQDKNVSESVKPQLVKLFNRNEDAWADCYTANQKLRAQFRKQNCEIKAQKAKDGLLLKKSSLDIPLLEEKEEDKKMAHLLAMKPIRSVEENLEERRKMLLSESSLPTSNFSRKKESNAVKYLKSDRLSLGIVKKIVTEKDNVPKSSTELNTKDCAKRKISDCDTTTENKIIKTSLVGDYGSSDSD